MTHEAEAPIDLRSLEGIQPLRDEFTRFMMEYRFGIEEVRTKISILQAEFTHLHDYSPIEHVLSRVKTPESILEKVRRRGAGTSFQEIREAITDIAGVRVTCSFVSDVYRVFDMLAGQPDLDVLRVKDYIATPKPNGYRSLHALVRVPVHLSDRIVPVTVELQLRTVAMDFWASLEHKIHYRFKAAVPDVMRAELHEAAQTAADLDQRMEQLHRQVLDGATSHVSPSDSVVPDDRAVSQLQTLRDQADAGRLRGEQPREAVEDTL